MGESDPRQEVIQKYPLVVGTTKRGGSPLISKCLSAAPRWTVASKLFQAEQAAETRETATGHLYWWSRHGGCRGRTY